MKRASFPSRKAYRRRKSLLGRKKIIYCLLVVIILIILLYLTCFYSFFQVKGVKISGNNKVSSEEIESVVSNNISRKILFLESDSVFLIDLYGIKKKVLNEFVLIKSVSFDRDFPDKLIVSVEERIPLAIFEGRNGIFFIDEDGVIFEEVEEREEWLTIKGNNFQENLYLGLVVISTEEMKKITEAEKGLKKLEVNPASVEIVNNKRMNFKSSEGWNIYFNLKEDISSQIFNLEVLLKEKISPEVRRNLEYVDLRFGNQLYYK